MTHQIKRFAFVLVLLLITSNINSQTINVDVATERGLMSKNVSNKINAAGSPYVDENFSAIRIDQYSDKVYTARYNAYNDEMEVKVEGGKVVALDNTSELTVSFTAKNKKYKTYSYTTEKGASKRGFLVVLDDTEKYALLKREYIKYYEAEEAASSYQQDKPATFRREDDTYFLKMDDKMMSIPLKKKSFLKAFPEHSSDLKTYIKKNKINLKKEADLKQVISYISEL